VIPGSKPGEVANVLPLAQLTWSRMMRALLRLAWLAALAVLTLAGCVAYPYGYDGTYAYNYPYSYYGSGYGYGYPYYYGAPMPEPSMAAGGGGDTATH
jgi:hypothetical protein